MMGEYFIKVTDGKDFRRRILEASKASINIMRSHHELKEVRKEKLHLVKSVRAQLRELTILVNMLNDAMPSLTRAELKALESLESMPKRRLKAGEHQVFIGKKTLAVKHKEPAPVKEVKLPKKSKREQLKERLASIEEKLSRL